MATKTVKKFNPATFGLINAMEVYGKDSEEYKMVIRYLEGQGVLDTRELVKPENETESQLIARLMTKTRKEILQAARWWGYSCGKLPTHEIINICVLCARETRKAKGK